MKKVLLVLLLLPLLAGAQTNLDSLWKVWKNDDLPDTTRLKAMQKYTWDGYLFANPDSAFYFAEQGFQFAKERNLKRPMAKALNIQGISHAIKGNYPDAIGYFTQCLKMFEALGDKQGVTDALNNIGIIHADQGSNEKAIEYYTKSLKITEEEGNKRGMANSLVNIGNIYFSQESFEEAIDYYTKSLKLREEIDDKKGIAGSLNNIGNIYKYQGEYDKAIEFYTKSLNIKDEIEDEQGRASSLNNIGKLYKAQGDYYKAEIYSRKSLEISQKIGAAIEIRDAAASLWDTYKHSGKYDEALAMHELYITTRDSIQSKENQKEIIRQELKYTFDKQADSLAIEQRKKEELALAEQQRREDVANKENEKKNLIITAGNIGLGMVLIFTFIVIKRLRITRKQKSIIEAQKTEVELQKIAVETAHKKTELQKHLIEVAHNEIKDSINYAKRLQDAILPSLDEVKKYLPNNFIFFKPKDVVSGDFYWFETLNGTAYLASADCTGHGVPGAMVSVVCSNALDRSVKEFGITEPAKILDKTRELVIETFTKRGDEVKDGMDIALCAFKDNKVIYAGANNPLWIVRKTDLITEAQKQEKSTIIQNGLSLIEYKSNKQPIGLYANIKEFRQQEIELYQGDSLYFFTDGFADQFGGEKGKKFKYKPFKRFLIDLNSKPMTAQEQLIADSFENWKGDFEQIDDVCVIGVKIEAN